LEKQHCFYIVFLFIKAFIPLFPHPEPQLCFNCVGKFSHYFFPPLRNLFESR